jgi:hypothetical protein
VAENWSIRGEYLAACNCRVSPCPCTTAGGDPTEGECYAFDVFSIDQGQYGNTDLSGLMMAIVVHIPGNILDGNWDFGLIVDEQANDDQFEAIRAIFSGEAGGTFGDIVPLVGNFLGVERASISFETSEGGESGSASADGSEFSYTPLKSPRGERTQVIHGALAFRDRIYPGKAEAGRIDHFGLSSRTNYGEWSDFEWSGP